jgi:hypothetical protein
LTRTGVRCPAKNGKRVSTIQGMRIQVKMGNVEEEKIEEVKIKVGSRGPTRDPW